MTGTPPARCTLPPCKSSLQRVLCLVALTGSAGRIRFAGPMNEDASVLLDALVRLGWLELVEDRREEGFCRLRGTGGGPVSGNPVLHLRQNGTALRVLTALVGLFGGRVGFTGDPGLARRPLGTIRSFLEDLGARFRFAVEEGRVPFEIESPGLTLPEGVRLSLEGGSQGATGLLLGLALRKPKGRIRFEGEASRGYLRLSLAWLRRFGFRVRVEETKGALDVSFASSVERTFPDLDLRLPSDPSAMAFPLAYGFLTGRTVELQGLDPDLPHPDLRLRADLEGFGGRFEEEGEVLRYLPASGEGGVEILDLEERPDVFPALCVMLASRPGRHRLGDSPRLRTKECDRIRAMAAGLAALGLWVRENPGGLEFTGGIPGDSSERRAEIPRIDTRGDHRVAMAFRVLKAARGIRLRLSDVSCVGKSWPAFEEALQNLQRT